MLVFSVLSQILGPLVLAAEYWWASSSVIIFPVLMFDVSSVWSSQATAGQQTGSGAFAFGARCCNCTGGQPPPASSPSLPVTIIFIYHPCLPLQRYVLPTLVFVAPPRHLLARCRSCLWPASVADASDTGSSGMRRDNVSCLEEVCGMCGNAIL